MSDPTMPPPPPPSGPPAGQGWQSQPQQPGPPPMGGGMSGGMPSWTNNITARGTMSGPGGLALADMIDRIIAWVIDGFIIGIVGWIVQTITTSILGDELLGGIFGLASYKVPSLISSVLAVVIMLAVTAAYMVYMWTRMNGATVGMRVMKLSVRDAASGGPLSQNQAITRWAYLGAPFALFWGLYGFGILGLVAWVALIAYEIYLIYSTASSPSRQGFHDVQAKTVVAKVM